jgi:hypothetical protein
MTIRQIQKHVNQKYMIASDKHVITSTIVRYGLLGVEERKSNGRPKISLDLLNCMGLHIKIQQLSKSGQAKGFMIKSKLAAAVQGTLHPTFDCDWAWR